MATNPTLLAMPLAENGTKNVIPATQATAGDGLFSQSTGFPAETSLPLGAGGVAPSREDFNGMANLLGGVAFYSQKGWIFQWDVGQDYYVGCEVIDNGMKYRALTDVSAGGTAPHSDGGINWEEIDPSIYLKTEDAKTVCTPFAFPSETYANVPVSQTNYQYTAPANGYCYFYAIPKTTAGGFVRLKDMDISMETCSTGYTTNSGISVYMPTRKGNIINWSYDNVISLQCRFIYAVGEV